MAIRRARPMSTMYRYYDPVTGETFRIDAPVYMKEDFLEAALIQDGSMRWTFAQVSAAGDDGTGGIKADADNGVYELDLVSAENEAASVLLGFTDQHQFDPAKGLIYEVRYRFTTAVPVAATTEVVLGLGADIGVDFDAITDNAWIRHEATGEIRLETDDAVSDTDDTQTGIHLVQNEWVIARIELIDPNHTRLFVNGVRAGSAVQHRMANSAANVSPMFGISRTAGTGLTTLEIDYFLVAQGAR